MATSRRGWLGAVQDWAVHNKTIATGLAACMVLFSLGVVGAFTVEDDAKEADTVEAAAGPGESDDGSTDTTAVGDTTIPTAPGGATVPPPAGSRRQGGSGLVGTPKPTPSVIPGAPELPPCAPSASYKATGISSSEVKIGQILSDVSSLPQQFGPFKDGLQAYVNAINAVGGVCGRKLKIEYRNDGGNPTNTYAQELAREVFALVASSSLFESKDYGGQPPFNPNFRDGDQYLPDIGGLALSYGRSQSQWYAGAIGSISPVLVGGGQFKFYAQRAAAEGKPCTGGGIVYLNEPTGASEDQGRLGEQAVRQSWGAGLQNVRLYSAPLLAPTEQYQVIVSQMVRDNVNCVFTYADLQSNINLVRAMRNQGVWPPNKCTLPGDDCFRFTYIPFASLDRKFINDGGEAAQMVNSFLPFIPPNENVPVVQAYLNALKTVPNNAGPSGFSVLGFASGHMFVEALGNCGSAPTRACVMDYLRKKDLTFNAGGLVGTVTPFKTTKVRCGDCGSLRYSGVFDFKHIGNCTISVRVQGNDFVRDGPSGFACDTIKVARGEPA